MNHQARMRWRCRRGRLELDIVLQRFIDEHYAQLDEHQFAQLEILLSLPDHDLWEIIIGNREAPDKAFLPLLKLLQQN
jgi:antitoxin CptB